MFTLIFICLIIIFWFEYAGLVNREKNLEFRQSFVKGICNFFFNTIAINHIYKTEVKVIEPKIIVPPETPLNMKEKENKLKFMYGMLVDAAENNSLLHKTENKDQLPEVVEFFD